MVARFVARALVAAFATVVIIDIQVHALPRTIGFPIVTSKWAVAREEGNECDDHRNRDDEASNKTAIGPNHALHTTTE